MPIRLFVVAVLMLCAGFARAQTTQPTVDRAALEIRANLEFNRNQYATALPILQKLAELSADQPDLLGPIQEKIRVCQKNITAKAAADKAAIAPDRTPHPAPKPGETLEMAIKDLGNFDYDTEKGGNIPADVIALSGSKIRLSGYMIPMDQAANITQFALVPSLFNCCFGQPPQLQHTMIVNCPKGKAVSYYPDEITVEGTLKVAERKDEGFVVSIFELEVGSVKPAAR